MQIRKKHSALVLEDEGLFIRKRAWQGLVLFLTSALLALAITLPTRATAPVSTRTQRLAAVAMATSWWQEQQREDGGVGGFGDSCEVAWVVALAGDNPAGPAWTPQSTSLLGACERDVPLYLQNRYAGRMAKVLRAVVASGGDPRSFGGLDLITELENAYDPDTGLYHQYSLFRHVLAVLALAEAGRPLPEGAVQVLFEQQRPDGSWGWPIDPTPGDGSPDKGDPDTTGRVLQALAAAGVSPNHPAIARALKHLDASQHSDAGWGFDESSNSDSTALVIEGLLAAGWNPESSRFTVNGRTPVDYLLSLQKNDGSFGWKPGVNGGELRSTLDAVPALLHIYPNDIPTPLRLYLPSFLSH